MALRLLTEDALLLCKHVIGRVELKHAQSWVTIQQRAVLVHSDPVGRSIKGCPWTGVGVKKCEQTLQVVKGYSTLITIDGAPVCLDTFEGFTESLPPVTYDVKHPGQQWVGEQE